MTTMLQRLTKLVRKLLRGLHYADLACKFITRANVYVQASNATPALKAASAALVVACDTFCTDLRAFKDSGM